MKNKRKQRLVTLGLVLLFLLGLAIMVYPFITQMVYRVEAKDKVDQFTKGKESLKGEDIDERIRLAKAYNMTLDPSKIVDPYAEDLVEGRKAYAKMLEMKELIGHIEVPKIKQDLPIYAGTSPDVLEKGAGHLEGTSLPIGGAGTHTVITAHRGLPTAELFTKLDELAIGDIFYIHNVQTVLAYKVDQIITVEPTDFSQVLVFEGKDYATLLTCTPYMVNSHRLLVRGHRIDYTAPIAEGLRQANGPDMRYRDYFFIILPILLTLLVLWLMERRDYKKTLKLEQEKLAAGFLGEGTQPSKGSLDKKTATFLESEQSSEDSK